MRSDGSPTKASKLKTDPAQQDLPEATELHEHELGTFVRPYRPGLPGIRAASGIHVSSQVAAMAEIPSLLTKAFSWIRVHPDEVSEAMEQRALQIAGTTSHPSTP